PSPSRCSNGGAARRHPSGDFLYGRAGRATREMDREALSRAASRELSGRPEAAHGIPRRARPALTNPSARQHLRIPARLAHRLQKSAAVLGFAARMLGLTSALLAAENPPSADVIQPVLLVLLCIVGGIGMVLLLPGKRETPIRALGGIALLAAALI